MILIIVSSKINVKPYAWIRDRGQSQLSGLADLLMIFGTIAN